MPGRCWSVEREEIVRRDWPLGVDNATILGRVNSLPGPLISVYAMQRRRGPSACSGRLTTSPR